MAKGNTHLFWLAGLAGRKGDTPCTDVIKVAIFPGVLFIADCAGPRPRIAKGNTHLFWTRGIDFCFSRLARLRMFARARQTHGRIELKKIGRKIGGRTIGRPFACQPRPSLPKPRLLASALRLEGFALRLTNGAKGDKHM